MKPQNDVYNLNETSESGKFGFEIFSNSEGLHFFHFNDANGNALLYSQGYSRLSSCENGAKSVAKNAAMIERYEIIESEEGWYLVLKAGNHQQIARSKNYESKGKTLRLQQYLLVIDEKTPVFNREKLKEDKPATLEHKGETQSASSKKVTKTVEAPYCQRFSLAVYKDPKTIRVEHIFTKNHQVFDGLESEEIFEFIKSNLPEDWQVEFPTKKTRAYSESPIENIAIEKSLIQDEEIEEEISNEDLLTMLKGVDKMKAKNEVEPPAEVEQSFELTETKPLDPKIDVVMAFINTDTKNEEDESVKEILAILRSPSKHNPVPEVKDNVQKMIDEPGLSLRPKKEKPDNDQTEDFMKNPKRLSSLQKKKDIERDTPFLKSEKKDKEEVKDLVHLHMYGRENSQVS